MRRATTAEIARWDEMIVANPDGGNMLQTRAWGEAKVRWGWRPRYMVDGEGSSQVAALFLRRSYPGLGEIWYAPKGPGVTDVGRLAAMLRDRNGLENVFAMKVEPEIEDSDANRGALSDMGCEKVRDIQIHRATVIVDLRPDEDALLASFKPKTRYNIRLAARKGVTVEQVPCDEANIDAMYELFAATARRGDFALRPRDYYAGYWRLLEASGQGALFFARHEGRLLAALYAGHVGRKAWYKDGASSKERQELMAPHLLQWEVMRWLKRRGVESYDLVAVPRREELDESHYMWGLWRFKSGFCDRITEYVGAWDLPLHERRYRAWRKAVEPLVLRATWRLRHDLFY